MVDAKWTVDWRGCCEVLKSQSEVGMRICLGDFKGLFLYCWLSSCSGVRKIEV